MHFRSATIIAVAALFTSVFAVSTIDIFTQPDCQDYETTWFDYGDGDCITVTPPALRVTSLQEGCAVTVYTDDYCSDDATLIDVGICGENWHSFSVDC